MLQKDNNGLYFVLDGKNIYKFTEHFSVSEMFATKHKEFADVNWQNVTANTIINLIRLCSALELIRHFLGDTEVHVSSGYRCAGLNAKVGGVYNSYHTTGNAADILIPDTLPVRNFLDELQRLHILNEVLYYQNFVHVSVPDYLSVNDVKKYRRTINGKC